MKEWDRRTITLWHSKIWNFPPGQNGPQHDKLDFKTLLPYQTDFRVSQEKVVNEPFSLLPDMNLGPILRPSRIKLETLGVVKMHTYGGVNSDWSSYGTECEKSEYIFKALVARSGRKFHSSTFSLWQRASSRKARRLTVSPSQEGNKDYCTSVIRLCLSTKCRSYLYFGL